MSASAGGPNSNVAEQAKVEKSAQLIKAKVTQTRGLLKSDAARKYLAKRQKERGGAQQKGMYKLQARAYDSTGGPGDLAKSDGRIKTIMDMVDLHYGFLPDYIAQKRGGSRLSKDNSVLSTTTGVENVVFGTEVYSLLNSESNVYSLLEKRPWRRSGERLVTGRGHSLGSGGTGENASLPATDHPTWDTFDTEPRTVAHTFDVSQVEQLLADTEDDHFADDPMDWLRTWFGTGTEHQTGQGEHPKHINVQLCQDASNVGTNDFRSIDQVIASNNEQSNADTPGNSGYSTGSHDVYGFDRDSTSTFDANVDHNSGTDRNLTLDLLDSMITSVRQSSGKDPVRDNNYFWLTGHGAFEIIEQEVAAKERLEPVRTTVGMNGVQTQPGDDVGITVQAYKDIPIFRTDDVPTDGTDRIYLIDSSTLFIKQLLPTQYYETGISVNDDPFALDRLGNEGMYLTIGELTLTNPKAHGKIRDLQ
ncbi:MAG: phage major capsid protein [Halobacteria archaeon]